MRSDSNRDRLPAVVLGTGAVISVLSFGAVEQKGFALAQLGLILLGATILWRDGMPQLNGGVKFLLGLLLSLPLIQLIPLPATLLESLTAYRPALNAALQDAAIEVESGRSISFYPFGTSVAYLRIVCYLLIFLVAIRNYQALRRQPALVGVMVGLGAFEACYGLIQYTTGFPYIFFYKKAELLPGATGTYINRNHYAGLLEMSLPFLLANIFSRLGHFPHEASALRKLLSTSSFPGFFRDTLLFAVVLGGLVVSLSRAGIVCGLAGVAVAATVSLKQFRKAGLTSILLLLIGAGSLVVWAAGTPLFERGKEIGVVLNDVEMRLAIWKDTFRMIESAPLVGSGLGTYEWASMHYQSALLASRYEHAHNDLLETAAELGVPLALFLWTAMVVLLVRLTSRATSFHHISDRVLASGCAGAMTALLLHSFFDFNFQIPANALIFSWICGTAWALVHRQRRHAHAAGSNLTIDVIPE